MSLEIKNPTDFDFDVLDDGDLKITKCSLMFGGFSCCQV